MEKRLEPHSQPNKKKPKPEVAAALRANLKRRKAVAAPKKAEGS